MDSDFKATLFFAKFIAVPLWNHIKEYLSVRPSIRLSIYLSEAVSLHPDT